MATPMQLFSLSRRERNSNEKVGSFDPNRKHSDKSRWICIYPVYINSKKTLSEGRRVAADKAVENPTINEIKDVLVNAGFEVELEINKVHPREMNKYDNLSRGRIRVHFRHDDSTLVKPEFKNRDAILLYLCETIPKLKTRGSAAAATNQSQAGGSNTGKKSKNKK